MVLEEFSILLGGDGKLWRTDVWLFFLPGVVTTPFRTLALVGIDDCAGES